MSVWNSAFAASPADGDSIKYGAGKIRELKGAAYERLVKEHVMDLSAGGADVDGWHRAGSAKGWYGGSAPTKRPDGITNLDAEDAGRIWLDTSGSPTAIKVWDGTAFDDTTDIPSPASFVIETITSGSGNWTVPAGVTQVKATAVGGGGGGGAFSQSPYPSLNGGGGGAGATVINTMAVVPLSLKAYAIGLGGAGAGAGNTAGGNGGSTTFDTLTAGGGNGAGNGDGGTAYGGGSGGVGSGGDLNIRGSNGENGQMSGGHGGSSTLGGNGYGASSNSGTTSQSTAGAVNSGGGGGGGNSTYVNYGKAGGSGIIILEYQVGA